MGKLEGKEGVILKWPKFLISMQLVLFAAIVSFGPDQCSAQTDVPVNKSYDSARERLRERAGRVQEHRKARVTQAQREAAAARAKAAREKEASRKGAPVQTPPEQGGKGGAK
ncbi:hypothetical protein Geob_3580 [Geotalea daltonii FRC-32]|uniref:Uncharacterized protein n=1 Tax=Geotalea daltonii (strain DSM 22248 / JCM 15807 / FRC-32) TaxID=316067 RepID=B9M6D3_GEODF|nr:hypothetical protein Geob_3580 [Geotalea daltonii FRC-32]